MQQYDKGQLKKNERMLIGAEFQTASSAETSLLIMQLIYNFQHRSETDRISNVKLLAILDPYIQFELLCPFSDGNG
nr:hypothetical protein [Desemzia sp. RIT 804]